MSLPHYVFVESATLVINPLLPLQLSPKTMLFHPDALSITTQDIKLLTSKYFLPIAPCIIFLAKHGLDTFELSYRVQCIVAMLVLWESLLHLFSHHPSCVENHISILMVWDGLYVTGACLPGITVAVSSSSFSSLAPCGNSLSSLPPCSSTSGPSGIFCLSQLLHSHVTSFQGSYFWLAPTSFLSISCTKRVISLATHATLVECYGQLSLSL